MKGFSGVGVIEESPDSDRMYYSQLFYRDLSHQQRHEIHIAFVWNTELHLNVMQSFYVYNIISFIMHFQHISQQYAGDSFLAGCHKVVQMVGEVIEVVLDTAKWTKVMDGQWEIHPSQPMVCAIKNIDS